MNVYNSSVCIDELFLCSKKLVNRKRRREKESKRKLKKQLGCLEVPSPSTLQAGRKRSKKSFGERKKSLKRNWQKKNKQRKREMTVGLARRDTERGAETEQERGREAYSVRGIITIPIHA